MTKELTAELTAPDVVALIGDHPGISKIDLSDRLDVDVDAVDIFLIDLCKLKTIKSHMTTAKNGLSVVGYTLTDIPLPSIFEKAVASIPISLQKTHAEKAIDFIIANGGTATSVELHGILGLKQKDYVSTYLGDAVRQERLNKDGHNWTLGKQAPVVGVKKFNETINLAKAQERILEERRLIDAGIMSSIIADNHSIGDRSAVSRPTIAELEAILDSSDELKIEVQPNGEVRAVAEVDQDNNLLLSIAEIRAERGHKPCDMGKLAFALWSTGEFHIARGRDTILVLHPDELAAMLDYLKK